MGLIDKLFPRSGSSAVVTAPSAAAQPAAPAQAPRADIDGLNRRRTQLSSELAERQWDLGGVTYEMAARDHFRLDVLVSLSAKLQQIDAELAEVERQLKLGEDAAAGNCPTCRAQHSRGAVFCWSCGQQLLEIQQPSV